MSPRPMTKPKCSTPGYLNGKISLPASEERKMENKNNRNSSDIKKEIES